MLLKQDGSVWTTGVNNNGQLGDGTTTSRATFTPVMTGPEPWVEGDYESDYESEDDDTEIGRLPVEKIYPSQEIPPGVFRPLGGVEAMAAGGYHSMILKHDGSVWSTGSNAFGQLGSGLLLIGDSIAYIKVLDGGVKGVAAGAFHSLVLKQDGSVWASGRNTFGQLGDGTKANSGTFTPVVPSGVQAVYAGHSYSMVLMEDGSVCTTGSNVRGQLGDGSMADRSNFVIVRFSGVKAVAAGFGHSVLMTLDGRIWATGWNSNGQFGDGSMTSTKAFVTVTRLTDVIQRATRKSHWSPSYLPSVDIGATTRDSAAGKQCGVMGHVCYA